MDRTVIIGYAGGYCQMRLDMGDETVTLEFRVLSLDDGTENYILEKQRQFATPAEAWAAVGKELGWVA